MEVPKSGLELERELTCSICAELLYQPLTLLDCLHTFCGSCLKEWFSYTANKIENAPNPPPPDAAAFTCPSCRAPVRDTRHSATFVTLLDMLITAHPEKARSDADKADMARKYKPGDQVIPKINRRERTAEERRADEADRRLVDSVREMSLRGTGGGGTSSRPRHRGDSRSRSSGDAASEPRQRRTREGGHRQRREEPRRENSDQLAPEGERRRRRRSESRQRQADREGPVRQIGHQSSLRSLISSADMNDRDIEREIEDFARQIQEEGLLDGLDLDNIDLTRDDELSHRITEAYRRRQRGRTRNETSSRSNGTTSNGNSTSNGHSSSTRPRENSQGDRAPSTTNAGSRQGSHRPSRHSRSASATGEDRRRPPSAWPGNLDVRDASGPGRRRANSNGRSTTVPPVTAFPTPSSSDGARPGAQSQTDLTLSPTAVENAGRSRPSNNVGRSSSSPAINSTPPNVPASSAPNLPSFATRATQGNVNALPGRSNTPPESGQQPAQNNRQRPNPPSELVVMHASTTGPVSTSPILSPTVPGHQRKRSQLYPEPSISCARCSRAHIEYEVHYNCHICANGQWNICLTCYRASLGCKHWFGFGHAAWTKWERSRNRGDGPHGMAPPHVLTARRYAPPHHQPGGAEGRKTLTAQNPKNRLEEGMFCSRCFAWTNQCYWRCEQCNESDWGFCNNCVNQGKSCSHMLLPLTNEGASASQDVPRSPRSPGPPATASVLTGPSGSSVGEFKPLTFATRCDICQDPIGLTQTRYHCFSCKSGLIADATPGDYDICTSCYDNLVQHGEISQENGHSGWRRCLHGHRMVVIGFTEGKIGLWRYVDHDLVGGRALGSEPYTSVDKRGAELLKWSWSWGDQKRERLVSKNVKNTAPSSDGGVTFTQTFPPDGGMGSRATAKWAWYPQPGNDDELMFPRGAEIKEVEDMNGDWFFGTYMGSKGVFPAPYVRLHLES